MEIKSNSKDENKARITTAVYVVIILLLLFFIRMKGEQYPPSEAEGVMINLGYMETGSTNELPETVEENIVEESTPEESTPTDIVENVVTQDVEETVAMETAEETVENANPTEEATENVEATETVVEETTPQVNDDAMFGQESISNNNANEGVTGEPGDQGNPDGNLESDIYDGVNSGLGDSGQGWGLSGRDLIKKPTINDDTQKTGTVRVKIKVDNQGNVISATFQSQGSNTTDSHLVNKAIAAAKRLNLMLILKHHLYKLDTMILCLKCNKEMMK